MYFFFVAFYFPHILHFAYYPVVFSPDYHITTLKHIMKKNGFCEGVVFIFAAAYIRVSTDEQTEYSPDAQIRAIKTYAKAHNITLLDEHIYIDEGKSGRSAKKRPAFMKMINCAKKIPRPFDVILVHKFDRFARNRFDSVVYKTLLQKECNIKVVSVTESIDNDKISLIMESILEAMAEYYSINLSEEVKKGMTEKAYSGKIQNKAPIGYKMDKGRLVVDEKGAQIVKFIFEKFLGGDSPLQIAKLLNSMGHRTKSGNLFESRQIVYILKNPIYCGFVRWNPKGKTGRDFDNPNLIIKEGEHEKIIDIDTFQKAQVLFEKGKGKPKQKRAGEKSHFLVGLVRCGTCKGAMANLGSSFSCLNYRRGKCKDKNTIGIKTLETLVLSKLKEDFGDGVKVKCLHEDGSYKEYLNKSEKLEFLKLQLKRAKRAYLCGADSLEEYKKNKEFIEDKIEVLKSELKNMKKEKSAQYFAYIPPVFEVLKKGDTLFKFKIISSIVKVIEFSRKDNTLKITYFNNHMP